MKQCISLLILLCLLLTGCGSRPTAEWEEGWVEIAPFLAAEPVEDFTFGESADTLGLGGVYYATWTNGDKRDFVNEAGESTYIFNSQVYVIAQEVRTEADAKTSLAQWMARERQNYECGEERPLTINSQNYILLPLFSGSETNPYRFGCAAFTIYGTNAVCVELVCSDTFTADVQAVLEEFLSSLHYNE